MNLVNIGKAINNLRPGLEFVITEMDLDSIQWLNEDNPPTKSQILAAIKKVETEEANAALLVQEKRASALAKLIDLGLTEEEIAAL